MMNIRSLICLALLLTLSTTSCKKDEQAVVFTGYRYFPANIGHGVIYNVDSIYKDAFTGIIDTARFQVREVIESVFEDNEGRPTLRLERYKRLTSTDPWVIYKVWTANVNQKGVQKKEDNITYQKLSFPVKEGNTWDGNAHNEFDEKYYEVTELNVPGSLNGLSFDSTLTILQNDEDNFVWRSLEFEKYATGVGMYYKEQFNGEYKAGSFTEFDNFLFYSETIVSYDD